MAKAAERLVRLLTERSLYLAAAESCTAGLVADALVQIPGASGCFWGSFVCYTPQAKIQMLGLGKETLNRYGLVSEETARAMAVGALERSGADAAVSVTGLAGGGSAGAERVPPGTVWIAAALRRDGPELCTAAVFHFKGRRNKVRQQAARKALEMIIDFLG
ncbi:MAG: CinA family protein [Treponema sp.]|jgi:PncC family amidohydrolase|nr:CinA family protein [Treponema sp.]